MTTKRKPRVPKASPQVVAPYQPKYVARLDPNDVYLGMRETDAVGELDVVVPPDCDLAPGRYRYDRDKQQFIPLSAISARDMDKSPNLMRAIALGFAAIRDGKPMPKETLDFVQWYEDRYGRGG